MAVKFTNEADPIGDIGAFDSRLVHGDFDGDGDIDILYQNGNVAGAEIGYKENTGNGTFVDHSNASAAGTPFTGVDFSAANVTATSFRVFDIDNDGDDDIVQRENDNLALFRQGSGSGGDGSPPTLVQSTPSDNAIGVSPSANITLTFDEAVVKGSGDVEIVRLSDGAVIQTVSIASGAITGSGATWTVDLPTDLARGTEYGAVSAKGRSSIVMGLFMPETVLLQH